MKVLKILLAFVGVLTVLALVVFLVLVRPRYHGEHCTWDLDLGRVRQLAASLPGDSPREIRVEEVTRMEMPGALACPGHPWQLRAFSVYAYQLVFADRTIVVDTAMSPAQAKEGHADAKYDAAAWQRVTKGLQGASEIYVTHEHADHMGGAFADDRWASKLRLIPRQLDSKSGSQPIISAAARAAAKVVAYERYLAIAPGVVLIEAPGHTTGSQMVYVRRADGAEVLLTGDTAWLADNIDDEQPPAKLAFLITKGDANANACQLSALKRLPDLPMMTGHDPQRMAALLERGVFVREFVEAGRP
jgi:glyoxylase-like metal-dependent hydrolase (beta-lactamase superfamily II)